MNLSKAHFIRLYYDLVQKGIVKSQKEFAEKLGVTAQSLTPVFDKLSSRGASANLQQKTIETFGLEADYFIQPINEADRVLYQENKNIGVKSIENIVERLVKPYEAQINLLMDKIKELQSENDKLKNQ